MKTDTNLYTFLKSLTALVVVISLTSCGTSRQAATGDNDGIYSTSTRTTAETSYEEAPSETEGDNRNYYKQYFQSKAKVYENPPTEDVIFTDVEGYTSSNAYIDQDGNIIEEEMQYSEGQAGWGENAQVSINIYNNPGFGYYGVYNPWVWHRPHWWYGSGWGISYWNVGWGWAHPFYGYGYYGGFGYPVWGGYYGHPYHYYSGVGGVYYNNIAYNRGRRNLDYGRSTSNARAQTRSDGYSRSEMNRRINTSRTAESARRSTNTRVDQSTRSNQRINTTRQSDTRQNTNRQNNTRTNRDMSRQNQSRNQNMSRPPATRSSGSINRGGGTMRSGGGTVRGGGGGGRRGGGM